jgi:hypothetical protein
MISQIEVSGLPGIAHPLTQLSPNNESNDVLFRRQFGWQKGQDWKRYKATAA